MQMTGFKPRSKVYLRPRQVRLGQVKLGQFNDNVFETD